MVACSIIRDSNLLNFFFPVKTRLEIVAQRALHAAKKKLRKEHQEEQEWNVQHKKVLVETSKADALGATGGKVADKNNSPSKQASKMLSDNNSGGSGGGGEASWGKDGKASKGGVFGGSCRWQTSKTFIPHRH